MLVGVRLKLKLRPAEADGIASRMPTLFRHHRLLAAWFVNFSLLTTSPLVNPTPPASAAWFFNFSLTHLPARESDTTGFSRVVLQLQPTHDLATHESDTTGFSRVVFQLQH